MEIVLDPDWFALGVQQIIGGGPRLVRDGEVHITGEAERFQRDVLEGRAPRTALGFTADHKLLLVTVNGRQPGVSVGMTLTELAELMLELGAVNAMNLDGGGSTTMVITIGIELAFRWSRAACKQCHCSDHARESKVRSGFGNDQNIPVSNRGIVFTRFFCRVSRPGDLSAGPRGTGPSRCGKDGYPGERNRGVFCGSLGNRPPKPTAA